MARPLDILLFAHGQAGVNALRALHGAGHTIGACFTHGGAAWQPRVADECARLGIPCSTYPAGADVSLVSRPDVVLSVFYGRKVEMPYLALGTIGAFNVAASQLPRYPGFFPTRWAILNDEAMWGVTVHQMTQNYCDGAILHKRALAIRPTENAYDLSVRVADAAATAAVEAASKLASGDYHLTSVDPAGSQFFGREVPFGGLIDWHQSAARIDSFVRALDFGRDVGDAYEHLGPPAAARIGTQTIGIFKSRFGGTMSSYPPGTITRCDDQVWVQAGRGHVAIDRITVNGVDDDAPAYLVARGFTTGDTFDTSHVWNASQPLTRELSHAA
jgi:methionyl-tRNA formyltransferase